MKKYAIQYHSPIEHRWFTMQSHQYDTLEEARRAYEKMPMKMDLRIVEDYTVVRYKPVKMEDGK